MPPYLFLRSRLFFQLPVECAEGFPYVFLRLEFVQTVDVAGCSNVVEVEIFVLIARDIAFLVDHFSGIFAQILQNFLVSVGQIGVEHGFLLDAHDIAPAGFLGKIEQVGLGCALHLRPRQPLRIAGHG